MAPGFQINGRIAIMKGAVSLQSGAFIIQLTAHTDFPPHPTLISPLTRAQGGGAPKLSGGAMAGARREATPMPELRLDGCYEERR
jgi:hypothetical protein